MIDLRYAWRQLWLRPGFTIAVVSTLAGATTAIFGLAFVLGRLLSSQLFEVSAFDPLTFITILLLIVLIASLASLLPALRAAGTNPSTTLRYE